jgi:hypothetical protein
MKWRAVVGTCSIRIFGGIPNKIHVMAVSNLVLVLFSSKVGVLSSVYNMESVSWSNSFRT